MNIVITFVLKTNGSTTTSLTNLCVKFFLRKKLPSDDYFLSGLQILPVIIP